MRIIRFLGEDSRVHYGEDHGDGTATILLDPQGVLGPAPNARRRDLLRDKLAVVADDDLNMQRLMATALEKVGCRCVVCADGAEAIRTIQSEPVDLVVSDIIMPEHNGYEVFAAAKSLRGDMPVVLVTGFGYDPEHVLVRASSEGLSAILYKPFTPRQLLDEISRAIRDAAATPADNLVRSDLRCQIERTLAPLEPLEIIRVDDSIAAHCDQRELHFSVGASSSLTGSGEAIRLDDSIPDRADLECDGQLALIIGSDASDVPEDEALRHVLGYTVANDIASKAEPQSTTSQAADTAATCPLGPAIITSEQITTPNSLSIETTVNGVVVSRGTTAEMYRDIEQIVSELSQRTELKAGTVILIGSPPGAQDSSPGGVALRPGDEVAVRIEGIGRLVNHIESA